MKAMLMRDPADVMVDLALTEALGAHAQRTRVTASRPLPPFHEDAFEEARKVFDRVYAKRYYEILRTVDEPAQAHEEATVEALEAFLGSYLEQVTL